MQHTRYARTFALAAVLGIAVVSTSLVSAAAPVTAPSYADILASAAARLHAPATLTPAYGPAAGQTCTYATQPSYAQRAEGYDWVQVTVQPLSPGLVQVSVNSRTDIKKATCTFTGTAYALSDYRYRLPLGNGRALTLDLNPIGLSITGATQADRDAAMYFCSGGGSLIGYYESVNP